MIIIKLVIINNIYRQHKKRIAANKRERSRMKTINKGDL